MDGDGFVSVILNLNLGDYRYFVVVRTVVPLS
jgi:hypothetical protein